eukprot:jgi/Chlat1/3819/Chrsp26S03969
MPSYRLQQRLSEDFGSSFKCGRGCSPQISDTSAAAMVKRKQRKQGAMDVDSAGPGPSPRQTKESADAMDTGDGPAAAAPASTGATKTKLSKRAVNMKTTSKRRKKKQVERALINQEKLTARVGKQQDKKSRVQASKQLY